MQLVQCSMAIFAKPKPIYTSLSSFLEQQYCLSNTANSLIADQIVVGSVRGRIWIIDPGRVNDSKQHQQGCLLEEELFCSIVDIAVANFIASMEQKLIAVLSPQKLIIYRLIAGYF